MSEDNVRVLRPPVKSPCPSRAVGILGFQRPTVIPCCLAAGHDGRHHYTMEWGSEDPVLLEQAREQEQRAAMAEEVAASATADAREARDLLALIYAQAQLNRGYITSAQIDACLRFTEEDQ